MIRIINYFSKKRKTIVFVLPIILLATGLSAQNQSPSQNKVDFVPVSPVAIKAGKSIPMVFTFHIKPGFHINSNKPSAEELIPTQLGFSPPQDLVIAKVAYPAGELRSFPFDPTQKLSVYSGDLAIKAVVIAQNNAAPGKYTVHGEFKYQACDNNACYPPKKLPVDFNVEVQKGTTHTAARARPNKQSPHIH
ncbi:MAG TPA: protein-disulfide reductase DsbD domain-containing protein [Candidatus Angelobacter sp.]|jgi:DsbC/DsbD-like thiol-disulfide interchange protein|nr:protein-disulfide reductase DsbD domain-containing protein [Candidatus Angelobacter sp.]